MTTYLIFRGAHWIGTAASEHEAMARQADEAGTRIEARTGAHERWTCPCPVCREWWAHAADWPEAYR